MEGMTETMTTVPYGFLDAADDGLGEERRRGRPKGQEECVEELRPLRGDCIEPWFVLIQLGKADDRIRTFLKGLLAPIGLQWNCNLGYRLRPAKQEVVCASSRGEHGIPFSLEKEPEMFHGQRCSRVT
jgi:hypothetical protein